MKYKSKVRPSRGLKYMLLLLLLFSLCGCERQSDSMKEELASLKTSDSSGDAVKEQSGQLKEQLHIPEELQIDVLSDDGMRGYQVNCKVDAPIETDPAVYQQRQVSFTREEIIKRAEKLFDSGEFSYVKPLDCYTLDELNEEGAKVQDKIDNKEKKEDYDWYRKRDIEFYQEFFKEAEVKDFKEGDFTKGAEVASYDKIMIMEGEIGGEVYHLLAFTSDGHDYLKLCKKSHGYNLTSIYSSIADEEEATQSLKNQYGENTCSYSEEEAGKLALQYAVLLGDEDMTIVKTNWCFFSNQLAYITEHPYEGTYTFERTAPNGYVFYLQRQYGNLPCNQSNFWWREAADTNEGTAGKADPLGIVAEQENYRVEVMDEGVVAIDSVEPWYEIVKTLSDSTSLMDFNDIQELAGGYFEEMVQDTEADVSAKKNITRISEVVLRYATVLYDGEYTLIPCWFFNQSDGNWGGMSTVMVINAIDGSKVFSQGT